MRTIISFFLILAPFSTFFETGVFATEYLSNYGNSLKLVQVIFRHGERYPRQSFPDDPNHWNPKELGRLTKVGEQQSIALGKFLRQRYDGFVSKSYEHGEIYAQSSASERAIMTGLGVLKGLYPFAPQDGDQVEKNCTLNLENSQIVPIHTVSPEDDNFLLFSKTCPKYETIFNEIKFDEILERKYSNILDLVNKNTGLDYKKLVDMIYVLDNIQVAEQHGKLLPNWITNEYKEFSNFYIPHYLHLALSRPELIRLRSGTAGIIFKNMRMKIKEETIKQEYGSEDNKLWLFSGHERTITSFLGSLNMTHETRPSYASAVLIELHKSENFQDFYVEMYFRNGTDGKISELKVPQCGTPCFIKRLEEITRDFVMDPKNFDLECREGTGSDSTSTAPVSSASNIKNFLVLTSILAVILSKLF